MPLLVTAIIVVAVFFFVILRATDAESRAGQTFMVLVLLTLLAFLPAWGSFLVVLIGSVGQRSHDYWSVAPWLIIGAVFQLGGFFISAATISGITYLLVRGEHAQKIKVTVVAVLLTGGAGLAYAAISWAQVASKMR